MDIKSALRSVGDQNRYQVYTIIFVSLKWMIVALMILGPSYMLMTPTFTCGGELKVSEEQACKRESECIIDNPFTITATNKLYCNDRFVRDTLLSSEYIGSVAGLIVLSILADKLGRKLIINVTLLLSTLGAILMAMGATQKIPWLIGGGIVLMGLGGYALSIVSFIYLGEVCSDRWRQVSIILSYTFWAIAEMLFYPIITYEPDWKFMAMAAIIAPLLLLTLMAYWIVETPQFLYNTATKIECIESLNYIADFNKKSHLELVDLQDRSQDKSQSFKIQDTLLKSRFLIPLIVLSIAQICNNGMYYITQYSVNQIGTTFEMNMLIIGALEFVGYLITNIYCHKMLRKRWIIFFMLISGGIGILFQFVFRANDNQWDTERYIETVCIGISRLANTFCFGLFSLITTQSFPPSIKATGTGITEAMSNLGNMAAPFIVTIAEKIDVQSMLIGGIVCVAGALVMFLSKETHVEEKKNLEESMIDEPLFRDSTLQANQSQVEVQGRS